MHPREHHRQEQELVPARPVPSRCHPSRPRASASVAAAAQLDTGSHECFKTLPNRKWSPQRCRKKKRREQAGVWERCAAALLREAEVAGVVGHAGLRGGPAPVNAKHSL